MRETDQTNRVLHVTGHGRIQKDPNLIRVRVKIPSFLDNHPLMLYKGRGSLIIDWLGPGGAVKPVHEWSRSSSTASNLSCTLICMSSCRKVSSTVTEVDSQHKKANSSRRKNEHSRPRGFSTE